MAKKPDNESVIDMFTRIGRDMKMPEVDIDRIIEHNRKNLEAFEKSARTASAGASSVFARQREIVQDSMRDVTDMAESMRSSNNPQELMGKQAEFARRSFETAVRNTGEMANLMRKTGDESLDILRQRIRESMEEIREGFNTRK